MRRIALGLLAGGLVLGTAGNAGSQEERVIEVVELEGVIDPSAADYLAGQIDAANDTGAEAVVVQLDTPGGLSVSMDEMVESILNSRVPVVVWVGPPGARAASAGVFLVYASHVAAMAGATNIGAAHPVDLGGGDLTGDIREKAENDATQKLVSLAQLRGRDEEFAVGAVRESRSITAVAAHDRGVIEVLANSVPELLRKIDARDVETVTGDRTLATDGEGITVRFHQPGILDSLLHALASPTVAYLLLILGFWAVVFEISQPGLGIAGIAGTVALILAFYSLTILPVNAAGLILVLLGLALFVIDVLTAGLGVFTVGGTIALAAGSILLFSGVSPAVAVSPWVIGLVVAGSVLFFGFAMTLAMRGRRRPAVTGQEGLVGLVGESRGDLTPEGQVWVKGAMWRGRAMNGPIPRGRRIRVRRVDGLLLLVQEESEEG